MIVLPFSKLTEQFTEQYTEEPQAYYWVAFIAFAYSLHTLINLEHRRYVVVFLVILALIGYDAYTKKEMFAKKTDTKDAFMEEMVALTQAQDTHEGHLERKYAIGKSLLQSDRGLWKALLRFKRLGQHEHTAYARILVLLMRFYEEYGIRLRFHKNIKKKSHRLDDMLLLKSEVLNAIQEFHLQTHLQKNMDREIQQLTLIVLASLTKCLRILQNRYAYANISTPYAPNAMGSEYQIF